MELKRIDEYTVFELGSMPDDEFGKLVKYELMMEGLPLEAPVRPPVVDNPVNPVPVGSVFSINILSGYFKEEEEALKVMAFLSKCNIKSYNYEWINQKYVTDISSPCEISLKKEDLYSKEDIKEYRNYINGRESNEYRKALEKYQEEFDTYNEFIAELRNKRTGAINRLERINRLTTIFETDYMPIIGDEENAIGLLKKAYSIYDEEAEYILSNYKKN